MRITIAITGASGAIYARQLVERLVELRVSVELIFTENGRAVAEYENQIGLFNRNDIKYLDNKNMFASPASGSGCADAMVIVPPKGSSKTDVVEIEVSAFRELSRISATG